MENNDLSNLEKGSCRRVMTDWNKDLRLPNTTISKRTKIRILNLSLTERGHSYAKYASTSNAISQQVWHTLVDPYKLG